MAITLLIFFFFLENNKNVLKENNSVFVITNDCVIFNYDQKPSC